MVNTVIDFSGQIILLVGQQDDCSATIAQLFEQAGATVLREQVALPADPALIAEQLAALPVPDSAILIPSWWEFKPFMESSPADWDAATEQNFEVMVYYAQALARRMLAAGKTGSIVYLTSVMTLMPFALTSTAATTLAAFRAVLKMAALDLAPHGIRVNAVAQGWVEQDSNRHTLQGEQAAHISASIPAGRPATLAEIAQVCAFLASPLASYITGTVIPVDGGYTLTRSAGSTPLSR
jgi:3-oxoacyl-[acyl-carrier protein] reductase